MTARMNPYIQHRRLVMPGFVTLEAEDTLQTTALDIRDGKIAGIYIMRNPDKLRQVRR